MYSWWMCIYVHCCQWAKTPTGSMHSLIICIHYFSMLTFSQIFQHVHFLFRGFSFSPFLYLTYLKDVKTTCVSVNNMTSDLIFFTTRSSHVVLLCMFPWRLGTTDSTWMLIRSHRFLIHMYQMALGVICLSGMADQRSLHWGLITARPETNKFWHMIDRLNQVCLGWWNDRDKENSGKSLANVDLNGNVGNVLELHVHK